MRYISTRGNAPVLDFSDIVISGLAPDGGLYMPETIPQVSHEQILEWKDLSYVELAAEVMRPFMEDAIPEADLQALLEKSYSTFHHPDIAPLVELEEGEYVLELFHGPTLAFKDFALQFLGNALDYMLEKRGERAVIIGATSGDTGSAAIAGCAACERVQLFMLHPHGRVSDIQRKQMTTVDAPHVHNLAVEGTFDDCQDVVKAMLQHPEFLSGVRVMAVNSINWTRILAQIVYYFYAYLRITPTPEKIAFSVPTGNFGDIFAGYIAHKMGLPVAQLIVATNKNDILHRFFAANDYSKQGVEASLSPSMDIQISSNFERLLFDLYGQDSAAVATLMADFKEKGVLQAREDVLAAAKALFASARSDDAETLAVIAEVAEHYGMVVDPHTATAIRAEREVRWHDVAEVPMVVLATAHAAKFPKAITEAGLPAVALPKHLDGLLEHEEHYTNIENDIDKVKEYIKGGI